MNWPSGRTSGGRASSVPARKKQKNQAMPDRFGPRGVCAVIIPQQNANMQPEYEYMRPDGINNQM